MRIEDIVSIICITVLAFNAIVNAIRGKGFEILLIGIIFVAMVWGIDASVSGRFQ